MQTLFEAVKARLNIYRTDLKDEQIKDMISEAKAELERSGVLAERANDENDSLIRSAVKAYCQWKNTDDEKMANLFFKSFAYQQDCIRKSAGYIDNG